MVSSTFKYLKASPDFGGLRLRWSRFSERYIATEAPADLDDVEAALDAEPGGAMDAMLVAVASFVTLAWTVFLIFLLLA